jgi:transposase
MQVTLHRPEDLTQLQQQSRQERDAKQRDRYRAVLLALDGQEAPVIARTLGRSRRFVPGWVYRYRDHGLEAVVPKRQSGRPPKLPVTKEESFKQRFLGEPTEADGVCTRLENQRNKRKNTNSSSRFKGVYWDKRYGKWYARCRYKGHNYGLGCYGDDEVAAARAYDRAAVAWFKEYARPNFPEEWPPERRAEVYAQRQEPPPRKKKVKRSGGKKARAKRIPPHPGTRGRRERKGKTKPQNPGR